ncbi:MAG: hypothetical protein C3F07_19835 [Anaerolineales bacterium]|nr:hypothetical protein [Anaerolineae bacterium]PWB69491.1 MAG: hypothetical protein C3F07_19835 [Anaerolineales bacterium]
MATIQKLRWFSEDSWLATLASLLPLWLWSLATTLEGFPRPPISLEMVAIASFWLAIPVIIVLLWKWWLPPDVLLVSLIPFVLLFNFDEISTRYKTPFILLCALILSIGIVTAQRSGSVTVRWLLLLFVAVAVLVLSSNAAQNYWQMASDLGTFQFGCFPDAYGCPPIPGDATPWWILFFS